VPFRVAEDTELDRLKGRLLSEHLRNVWEPDLNSNLRRAANEAAALAWASPYPLLVFPALFEEKAEEAVTWTQRQKDVRRRSRELLVV
jgi:hypothetical protein